MEINPDKYFHRDQLNITNSYDIRFHFNNAVNTQAIMFDFSGATKTSNDHVDFISTPY